MKRTSHCASFALLPALALCACGDGPAVDAGGGAAGAREQRLPVLMVHGSGMNASSWTALTVFLRRKGWPEEYLLAVDLAPDNGANIAAAEVQLQPAAEALLQRAARKAEAEGWKPPARLAVVGHSMGAVSGRWLAGWLMPERVAAFVAIAGANHGSIRLCGRDAVGDLELCPAHAQELRSVLERLNGSAAAPADETRYGPAADSPGVASWRPTAAACIHWYTIRIDPDEWIVPAASARLAGSGGGTVARLPAGIEAGAEGEFILRTGARHDDLPSTPAVMELVASLLGSAAAGCRR